MTTTNARPTRRRGVTGRRTRQLLDALREPGRTGDLMRELGWTAEEAHALVKHAHEQGRLTRVQPGVYQTSAAGLQALAATPRTEPGARLLSTTHRPVPAGQGWTPERKTWLDTHYGRLGHRTCAELLTMKPANVASMASKRGLRYGDVPGYTLLSDLAALTGQHLSNLYASARRAGMLTRPGGAQVGRFCRATMVPDAWADGVVAEMSPPTPDEVALETLRTDLGLSKTQIARKAHGHSVLRTPVQGGQARAYVPVDFAQMLRQEYARRRQQPRTREVGRAGYLAAYAAAGPGGATERELFESLGTSRAAVRLHTAALLRSGELERCRAGTVTDPFVYRLDQFQGEPAPTRRHILLPGRPRKVMPEAAD